MARIRSASPSPNWPVIDVTNRAIEETAADILRIYQERFEAPPASSTG